MSRIKATLVFGRAACALGLLTPQQADEAATTQEELESEGISLRFGEVLVEGKILTEEQVDKVLAAQGGESPEPGEGLFGIVALDNAFLGQEALDECLAIQQDLGSELDDPEQVPKIGEILLTEERMEAAQVESVLKVQQRLKVGAFSLTPSKMLLLKKKKKAALKVRSPEDALFCKLAVRRQLLTPDQVGEILRMQMEDPRPRTVGEIAHEFGYMDQLDVAAVQESVTRKEGVKERRKRHQTTAGIDLLQEDRQFSEVARKNGFVTQEQIRKAEKLYKVFRYLGYPRNVGEILFDLGHLSTDQIQAVTDIQRLKGAVLPPYRLQEILLSEKEDELLADLIKTGDGVTQDQVTDCLKIQRELRKYGVRRKIGEVMLVKGYLFREDLKRRPVLRRDRPRRHVAAAADRTAEKTRRNLFFAVGGAVALGTLVLLLALAMGSGDTQPRPKPDRSDEPAPTEAAVPAGPRKPPPDETGPPPGEDPAKHGYIQWKGRYIRKEEHKKEARRSFYESLRREIGGR